MKSNKKSLIKERSTFSSNIQTESSSRISYFQIKNLKLLKYSTKNKNNKKSRNDLKIPKLFLKTETNNYNDNSTNNSNRNFLYSFSTKRKSNKMEKIINIYNNNDNSSRINNNTTNYFTSSELNNSESKKNNNYIKIKEPFYQMYYTSRKDSIIDFKTQTRNIRLLKIDSYNGQKALNNLKESLLYNEAKTLQFKYSKNKEKILLNAFKNNFYSYISFLKRKADKEIAINENLIERKNILINKMMTMGNRISKILNRFERYLENKSFLLCIHECSINFNKFSKESQIDILYDLYKLYNYKNNTFLNYNNLNNIENFKQWIEENAKNIRKYGGSKKFTFSNYIIISIDINNFYKIFKCINKDYIKSHKVKNYFESTEDFNRALLHDDMSIRLSLNNFTLSNSVLTELKNELVSEKRRNNKIIEILNSTRNKRNLINQKLNIAKTNYLDDLIEDKYFLNEKEKIILPKDKINERIDDIINMIINYEANDIKQLKFERTDKKVTTIFDKLRYIEKVINYLMHYKEEQKHLNKSNYVKIMKEFKKELIIRKFKIREETMKKIQELKIKIILEKKDKILFLPHRK